MVAGGSRFARRLAAGRAALRPRKVSSRVAVYDGGMQRLSSRLMLGLALAVSGAAAAAAPGAGERTAAPDGAADVAGAFAPPHQMASAAAAPTATTVPAPDAASAAEVQTVSGDSLPGGAPTQGPAATAAEVQPLAAAGEPRRAGGGWLTDWATRERGLKGDQQLHYLIGAAVRSGTDFFGGAGHHLGLRPVLAAEWGRWRFSQGGGYGLMGHGRDGRRDRGSGLEGMLRATSRFNLSLSLNLDRGRDASAAERLLGATDVPTTVRARVRARYFVTPRWVTSLAVAQDILGKGGGLDADAWVGYDYPLTPATRLGIGAGASWGNGPYMRSQFGVPAAGSAAPGRAPFSPAAGLYQSDLGVDLAHALSRHWVAFGNLRLSRLHGDAARSPLIHRTSGVSVSVGIAWRN